LHPDRREAELKLILLILAIAVVGLDVTTSSFRPQAYPPQW
jgi:hypothetical protein